MPIKLHGVTSKILIFIHFLLLLYFYIKVSNFEKPLYRESLGWTYFFHSRSERRKRHGVEGSTYPSEITRL
jgi:hypothetical protein